LSEEAGSPVTSEGGDAAGVALGIYLPAVRRYGASTKPAVAQCANCGTSVFMLIQPLVRGASVAGRCQ
jgi:hypothetical protein